MIWSIRVAMNATRPVLFAPRRVLASGGALFAFCRLVRDHDLSLSVGSNAM